MKYTKEVRFQITGKNAHNLFEHLQELESLVDYHLRALKLKIDGNDLVFVLETDTEFQDAHFNSLLTGREFQALNGNKENFKWIKN